MKRIVILTVILATLALGMSSCKKYENDDKRSWSSPKSRIVGTWKVVDESGIHAGMSFTFEKNGEGYMTMDIIAGENEIISKSNFKWEFGEKKNSLIVEIEHKGGHGHGQADGGHIHKDEYKIIQLTKKNLWIVSEIEVMGKKSKVDMKLVKV